MDASAAGDSTVDERSLQQNVNELLTQIGSMPDSEQAKLAALAKETKQRHERIKQSVSSLQDSIDYLRLSVKYILFDLEATRRENAYLRKVLEEGNDA